MSEIIKDVTPIALVSFTFFELSNTSCTDALKLDNLVFTDRLRPTRLI